MSRAAGARSVRVWDLPVRVCHWLLVALMFTSWVSGEIGDDAMTYHMWSGYAILTLVAFRIVWGLIGGEHARFADFVHGLGTLRRYVGDLLSSNPSYYAGHNPLGGVSVMLMLAGIALQATSGLFANDEIGAEGPLAHVVSSATSGLLTAIHRYNFYVLAALVALHVAAVLFYLVVKQDNLIAAMFTGRKQTPAHLHVADARMGSVWRALAVIVVIAGALAAIVNWNASPS